MVFPLIKLGYLAVRQVSKPVANQIKLQAKTSPTLSKYVCIPVAQVYHRTEQIFKMALLGLGRPVNIVPLNEQMAVDLGADIIGEAIVFGIAVIVAVAEYNRSSAKAKQKEDELMDRLSAMNRQVDLIGIQMEQQNAKLRELHRLAVDSSLFSLPFARLVFPGRSFSPDEGTGSKVLRVTFTRVSVNRETSGKISAQLTTAATTTSARSERKDDEKVADDKVVRRDNLAGISQRSVASPMDEAVGYATGKVVGIRVPSR